MDNAERADRIAELVSQGAYPILEGTLTLGPKATEQSVEASLSTPYVYAGPNADELNRLLGKEQPAVGGGANIPETSAAPAEPEVVPVAPTPEVPAEALKRVENEIAEAIPAAPTVVNLAKEAAKEPQSALDKLKRILLGEEQYQKENAVRFLLFLTSGVASFLGFEAFHVDVATVMTVAIGAEVFAQIGNLVLPGLEDVAAMIERRSFANERLRRLAAKKTLSKTVEFLGQVEHRIAAPVLHGILAGGIADFMLHVARPQGIYPDISGQVPSHDGGTGGAGIGSTGADLPPTQGTEPGITQPPIEHGHTGPVAGHLPHEIYLQPDAGITSAVRGVNWAEVPGLTISEKALNFAHTLGLNHPEPVANLIKNLVVSEQGPQGNMTEVLKNIDVRALAEAADKVVGQNAAIIARLKQQGLSDELLQTIEQSARGLAGHPAQEMYPNHMEFQAIENAFRLATP